MRTNIYDFKSNEIFAAIYVSTHKIIKIKVRKIHLFVFFFLEDLIAISSWIFQITLY